MLSAETASAPSEESRSRRPGVGLLLVLVLVAAAMLVPRIFDWQIYTYAHPGPEDSTPLHGRWDLRVGPSTPVALLLAVLGWRYGASLAERLSLRALLVTSYGVAAAWMLSLALVDGRVGLAKLGHSYEYLQTARRTHDFPAALHEWVGRIPLHSQDNWPTHVAGHPPGALGFFVVLDRFGLSGDVTAGIVVALVAATIPAAVLLTARALGVEAEARRAGPFLVLGPAALWMCVSADAVFGTVAAWGLCALSHAATSPTRSRLVCWGAGAGVLLGTCVMLSYGLPLLGLLALAVLAGARRWGPLPVAAAAAAAVVLAFAAGGFALWEAYPVLRERYWDGVASDRPAAYWIWGDLAALFLSAGPLLGAGLAAAWSRRSAIRRPVHLLVLAAAASIVIADLSLMSKAEVERIWLPFVPWLLLSTAALPPRWRRPGLALQLVVALVLQHTIVTSW